ncbi:MAG: glutamate ABC transporter substrate-binding protein [Nocardioides sp.]|uniref:glutamate ABC transporter substrate-binding protein n=1 Tax=Nocardioides sp. TaxID=35761 RepID=UPI0039E3B834
MKTSKTVAVAGAVLALSGFALTGCGSTEPPKVDPSLIAGASEGGSMTIGISFTNPGLGLKDGDTYSGFDVTTAEYVAGALGVAKDDITWVEATPGNREELLTSGQADMVVSTYSITDERKKEVAFAGPYFEAHQDLLVRRNTEEITGPETLDGHTLCSTPGSTSSQYVLDHYKGKITLVERDNYAECVQSLLDGDVDAVTTDDVILAGFASESKYKGKLKVVGDGFTDEYYGIGLPKGDTTMVKEVNAALKEYIADGTWKQALEAYVTPSGYQLPSAPTPGVE